MRPADISIILPVKDAEDVLPSCIESILTQNCNWELIVVYANSSDGTEGIIAQNKDLIQHLIHDEGKGVYAAMNQGIQKASGDWLFFLGADDRLEKNALVQLFELREEDSRIIFGDVKYVSRKHRAIPEIHRSSFSSALYWRNTLHHQGSLYARSLFTERCFDPGRKILADYELNLQFYLNGTKAKATDILVCTCLAGGLSKIFNKSLYREELAIKKELLPLHLYLLNIPWVWSKYLVKHYFASSKGA